MKKFWDEVSIISPIAWIIAGLCWVGMFCMLLFFAMPVGHDSRYWPHSGQIAFSIWPGLILAAAILLVGYINADARRRGMRYIMWTLLALLLPNSIGIILYFVFREPLLIRCGKCGAPGRANFTFCPHCGAELAPSCPTCKRAVDRGWKSCAYCGAGLNLGAPGAETKPANR